MLYLAMKKAIFITISNKSISNFLKIYMIEKNTTKNKNYIANKYYYSNISYICT